MLRKFFGFAFLTLLMINCESDTIRERNPFVPNYPFAIDVNMELPQYSSLLYPSNAVLVTIIGAGANGVIVFNAGGNYLAYEANCPNQSITSCSQLQINGIRAVCPCDELEYNLFNGVPVEEGSYAMIPYRIQRTGNILRISN